MLKGENHEINKKSNGYCQFYAVQLILWRR